MTVANRYRKDGPTTVASLRALITSALPNGSMVYLNGRSAVGDGAGGDFMWLSASQATLLTRTDYRKNVTAFPGSNQLTSATHGYLYDGLAFIVNSTRNGYTANVVYYAKVIDANTLTTHPTFADAKAGTNSITPTGTAAGLQLRRLTDWLGGIYVCPATDLSGASGAWVRVAAIESSRAPFAWWGVKSDDLTDNTEALQAAIEYCTAAGFTTNSADERALVLASGNTRFSRSLYFEKGLAIFGTSRDRSILKLADATNTSFDALYLANDTGNHFRFENWRVDGNRTGVAGGTQTGVHLETAGSYSKSIKATAWAVVAFNDDAIDWGNGRAQAAMSAVLVNDCLGYGVYDRGATDAAWDDTCEIGSFGKECYYAPDGGSDQAGVSFNGKMYGGGGLSVGGTWYTLFIGGAAINFLFEGQIDRSTGAAIIRINGNGSVANNHVFKGIRMAQPGSADNTVPFIDVSGARGVSFLSPIANRTNSIRGTYLISGDGSTEMVKVVAAIYPNNAGTSPLGTGVSNGVGGITVI